MMLAIDRFKSFIKVDQETGCWEWQGGKTEAGYGSFHFEGKKVYAHRWAHEYWNGPIPRGLTVDHVWGKGCTRRSCVNPEHLEAVSLKDNILRGNGWGAKNARKTHCKHGHEYTPENTGRWNNGGRTCRTCDLGRKRKVTHGDNRTTR